MGHRKRIRAVNSMSSAESEKSTEEIRITTDTIMTNKRTAPTEVEPHDVSYPQNDARSFIQKKRRRRCAAEIAMGVEETTPEAQLDEECKPRSSPSMALRIQTTNVIYPKGDANLAAPFHRRNHCASPHHRSPECDVPAENLECSFCNKIGHLASVCFQAHPERAKNGKWAKNQQQTEYAPLQTCNHCGSDHKSPECNVPAENLRCSFCKRIGHVESVCFQAHPERARNGKWAKNQQQTEYAPLQTCNHCGSGHNSRECNVPAESLHYSFCKRIGHVESVCFQAYPKRKPKWATNQKQTEYIAQQRDAALVAVQDKEREIECMRKKITEGDKKKSEYAAIVTSMRADYRKLKAERDELKRETDARISSLTSANVRLHRELDDVANANARLRRELEEALNAAQDSHARCDDAILSFTLLVDKCKELEMQMNAAQNAFRDEKLRSDLQFEEIRKRKSLEDDRKKRETLATARSIQANKQKLAAEVDEQRQKADAQIRSLTGEKTSLQNEVDAARIAIQAGKTEFDHKLAIVLLQRENVEKKLAVVEGQRDAKLTELAQQKAKVVKLDIELQTALTKKEDLEKNLDRAESARGTMRLQLDRQTALVIQERNDKLKMQKTLTDLKCQKRKLQSDVSFIREEAAEDKRKADAQIQSLTGEKTSLRNEVDAARIAIQAGKTEFDHKLAIVLLQRENVEKKLAVVEGQRDAKLTELAQQKAKVVKLDTELQTALTKKENLEKNLDRAESARGATRLQLDRQTALVVQERNDKLKMQKTLTDLKCQKRKLQSDVSLIGEEAAEDKRKADAQIQSLTGEKTSLQNEVDVARVAIQAVKTKCHDKLAIVLLQKENVEKKLAVVEGRRDSTLTELAQQKAKVVKLDTELQTALTKKENLEKNLDRAESARVATRLQLDRQAALAIQERNDKLKMQKNLSDLIKKLQSDVSLIREEAAEDESNLVQAHKYKLDEARTEMVCLKRELESSWEERNRLERLQYDVNLIREEAAEDKRKLDEARTDVGHLKIELQTWRKEKNRLEMAHEGTKRNLEEEKDKSLCQICMESPRNTIIMPCMHLHYCLSCLTEHTKRSNSCPSCRTTINGLQYLCCMAG